MFHSKYTKIACLVCATLIMLLSAGCQTSNSKNETQTSNTVQKSTTTYIPTSVTTTNPPLTHTTSQPTTTITTTTTKSTTKTTKLEAKPSTTTSTITVDTNGLKSITMSFVGDLMIASMYGKETSDSLNGYANKKPPTYFLEKVAHIFNTDDYTIGNLENVFTDKDLKEIDKGYTPAYWFRSKTKNTAILTSSGVEGVSLANNHTDDYGKEGREDTIKAVKEAGLNYGNNDVTMYFEKDGFRIAVICHGLWYEGQEKTIIKRIDAAEKESDYQIVFFHGGKEKIHEPEAWKQRASHKMVDAGADLIIGNHPHVLQPKEVYNGVEIIYSLGNFCYGGHTHPENRTIIYQMTLYIDDNNVVRTYASNIIPCYVYTGSRNNYQPAIIEDKKVSQKVIDFMNGKEKSPL